MFPIPFNFPFRKKDGSLTTIDAAISGGGTPYTLPTASADTKGGVKIGSGLTMDGETLKNTNPTPYTLPAASDETLGGVKVGDGLSIDENGVLFVSGGGGGGITLTLINDTEIAGNVDREISDVDLTNHKGLVIFAKYHNSSFYTPTMLKKSSDSPMGGKLVTYGTNSNAVIIAERLAQYTDSTHKLVITKNNWVEFSTNAVTTHVTDSSPMCDVKGVYYYD